MQTTREFLRSVLHTEGRYCLVGLKKGKVRQTFVDTIEEIEELASSLVAAEWDVYFGCAKFGGGDKRTQENVLTLKSLYLDLDCGEGKPYEDQESALHALQIFCKQSTLPRPTIVSSGRGVHAYWPLTAPTTREIWQPIAEGLKKLCQDLDLKIDPAVTADSARILRIPSTKNFKATPPLDVEILFSGIPTLLESLAEKIPQIFALKAPPSAREKDPLTEALAGNIESSFKKIMVKCSKGEGCAQITRIIEEQETLDEPMWRAGLSIAQCCTDRVLAIRDISREHPSYNASEADAKARTTKGPYTCAVFEQLYPQGCVGCKHKGKITSPIQLGKVLKEASTVMPTGNTTPAVVSNLLLSGGTVLPFPYVRGLNGGVYLKSRGEDEDDKLVYPHDLYLTGRINDFQLGEIFNVRLHLPKDEVRDFSITSQDRASSDVFKSVFAKHGVVGNDGEMKMVRDYITEWAKTMQGKQSAKNTNHQFGWTKDNTFVLGDQEYSDKGNVYSPPGTELTSHIPNMTSTGTLEKWKEIINNYGRPGFEGQALCICAGFGTALMQFSGLRGGVINMISPSGTGKTTTLQAIASIWGNPLRLVNGFQDTENALFQRLGVMNSLPFLVDEVTNWNADRTSSFLYGSTLGMGKNRLNRNASERANKTSWTAMSILTSNASLADKVSSTKQEVSGEIMRMIELYIPRPTAMTKAEADATFYQLQSNYGLAGPIFISYMMQHQDECKETYESIKEDFEKEMNIQSFERYWSSIICVALAGGYIAKKIGLLPGFHMSRIYENAIKVIKRVRETSGKNISDPVEFIGGFINLNKDKILKIDGKIDKRSGIPAAPMLEPRNELLIRIEPDTNKMYLPVFQLRAACSKAQVSYNELVKQLREKGICTGVIKKRMGKGYKVDPPPVTVLELTLSHTEFDVIGEEDDNETRP